MDEKTRLYIYAFLSRVFTEALDKRSLSDLADNKQLLQTIGKSTADWFANNDIDTLQDELNIDYSSIFIVNNHPIESAVMDSKNEILVGLQNPVMQFYFNHGYELNLEGSKLYVPDHAGIEFGFMQSLISQKEIESEAEFLHKHLIMWIVPFLIGIKPQAQTPFYRDLFDFTIEFLLADYSALIDRIGQIDA